MTALATASVFEAVSRVAATAAGVKCVMGVNIGTAQSPIVLPLGDELPSEPAIVIVPGPWQNIAGGAARVTYGALASIFMSRQPGAAGDASVTLMNTFDALVDAFADRSKAFSPTPILQYVLITEGPGLQEAEWPVDSNAWYLTWPFELEIKVNPNNLVYRAQ